MVDDQSVRVVATDGTLQEVDLWKGGAEPRPSAGSVNLLSPPEQTHGEKEIGKKGTPEIRQRDRIRHGSDDGCERDADSPLTVAGGPRCPPAARHSDGVVIPMIRGFP